jgi:hypothetical protein
LFGVVGSRVAGGAAVVPVGAVPEHVEVSRDLPVAKVSYATVLRA